MAGSKVDADLVRELARLLGENDLTEIEWSEGDRRVRVVRSRASVAATTAHETAAPPPPVAHEGLRPAQDSTAVAADHPGAVRSPMVGTVYRCPHPDADPFVTVGDTVSQGQTLFIVEAMKTMNPIPAPRSGVVAEILVADAAPVEYGQILLILE